jgi:hypothetical protein
MTTSKVFVHILCIAVSATLLHHQRHVDALAIGKRTIRRPFFRGSESSIATSPHPDQVSKIDDEELFVSKHTPSSRKSRRKRGKSGSYRKTKQRDFQLNYKDTEDELIEVQEKRRLRRVLSEIRLRALRRNRLTSEKAATTFDVDEGFVADDLIVNADASLVNEPLGGLESASAIGTSKAQYKRSVMRKKNPRTVVSNIHELREAILDNGLELRDIELNYTTPASLKTSNSTTFHHFNENCTFADTLNTTHNNIFTHDVLNLLHQRYHSHSTPANRSVYDNATLALAIEGGGMRGAVSGGMAAAIVCLGLSNAFDAIYGSSAGSIIGSYFVSRQLYLDVYTDVIPAGFDLFVSKAKIIGDMFRNLFLVMKGRSWKRLNGLLLERFKIPRGEEEATTLQPTREGGLNISFVLDSIMCPDRGLRPLDLESFAHNDEVQPLRIVSSAVELESGKLTTVVFGSKDGHFSDSVASSSLYPEIHSAQADDQGYRRGFWACLGASMSVPGAAGNPFPMDLPSSSGNGTSRHLCFDAFCYEPVPYRSAVQEGATHVLALRSRPAGAEPKTKPTLYERAAAPLYFRSHKAETVAKFFECGGQQYLNAEDVLTCDEGLEAKGTISIPPTQVLYGGPEEASADIKDRDKWKQAHLLPIAAPADVPELGTLADDREEIIAGIRSGFAAVCTKL